MLFTMLCPCGVRPQGLYVIRDEVPTKVFDYMQAVLERNADFSTANTVDKTQNEVLRLTTIILIRNKTYFLFGGHYRPPYWIVYFRSGCTYKQ